MLRSALKPFANLHDAQFMLSRDRTRRGPAAVRKALLTALAECGPEYEFIHFDVESFYGSISHAWLERYLGIDPAVVRRQVHLGQMILVPNGKMATVHDNHEASRERGQRGIPQGSLLSCLIAEQVMASVIRSAAVLRELPMFVWSDNVGVLAPRQEAGEIIDLVRAAFAGHGAGPFEITVTSHRVTEEFKFLGVNYRITAQGRPIAYIAHRIVANWELSIGDRLMVASIQEVEDVERHVMGKRAAWGWWNGWSAVEARVLKAAQCAREGCRREGACLTH